MPDPNPVSDARRAAVIFVFITIVLDMVALGMVVPVLPKLVINFVDGDTARAARIYDGPDEVHRQVVAQRILKKFQREN